MANSTKKTKRRSDAAPKRNKLQPFVLRMSAPAPLIESDGRPVFLPNWLNQLSAARTAMVRAEAEIERKRQARVRLLRANLTRRGILRPAGR